jgi:elongation factor G
MSKDALQRTRNIGIVAHIDAGKTTSTERILYYTGMIHRMGEVNDGTTVTDWMKQERERGITITSAAVTCLWRKHQINIIDTPGHVDFTMEVERSLRVLDGAVVVFCAVGGVQPQSETVWRQADRYGIPKIVFVNKMDRVGASFANVCGQIHAKFRVTAVPITVPDREGAPFSGVVDLVDWKFVRFDEDPSGAKVTREPVPAALIPECERQRKILLETVADADEAAMEAYLSTDAVAPEKIREVLRRLTLGCKVVPVLAGSALKNKGLQPLLDAVVDYLPSPIDVPPVTGYTLGGELSEKRQPNPQIPFSAFAFKIQDDSFANQLTYLRIYSGTVRAQAAILNASRGRKEKLGRIVRMYANKREDLPSASAGDIVAAVGLKWTKTGDTLCDPDHPLLFEKLELPEPVVFVAIEPKLKADEGRLEDVLGRLATEDPSFLVRTDPETGQRIICGMGELHLEVIVTRILEDYKVPVHVGKPQVAYRETPSATAVAEAAFDKPFAGRQQYAAVTVEVSPAGRGAGFVYEDRWVHPKVTETLRTAIHESIRDALSGGVLAGYPVTDLRAEVQGGTFDEALTTEMALRAAASTAVRDALRKAGCVLMEPVMAIEITAPKETVGDVIGDFNARGGKVIDMALQADAQLVKGTIPLGNTFGYATQLRSLTQGRGTYTMQFLRYEPIDREKGGGKFL